MLKGRSKSKKEKTWEKVVLAILPGIIVAGEINHKVKMLNAKLQFKIKN